MVLSWDNKVIDHEVINSQHVFGKTALLEHVLVMGCSSPEVLRGQAGDASLNFHGTVIIEYCLYWHLKVMSFFMYAI